MCLSTWLKEVNLSNLRITSHEVEQRVIGEKEAREQKVAGAVIEERVELLGERKVF